MGTLSAGVAFHFAGPPLDICVRDAASPDQGCQVEGNIINNRLRADLGILYGFGRFDARLMVPFVLNQSSEFAPGGGMEKLGSYGAGDPKVGLRLPDRPAEQLRHRGRPGRPDSDRR